MQSARLDADGVAVRGRQIDSPAAVSREPADAYVAGFREQNFVGEGGRRWLKPGVDQDEPASVRRLSRRRTYRANEHSD